MSSRAGDVLAEQAEADLEAHLQRVIDAAPGCAELLTRQFRSEREEFLGRLCADQDELALCFGTGAPLGQVTALEAGLSDRHRGGRTVFRVTFATGRTLAYKPRDGRTDAAFYAFLAWLRQAIDVPRSPASLARPTHGWFEFVETAVAEPGNDAERYWRRLGALIGVVDMLGGRDCHRENLVASGDSPVLVDAEALFHRPVGHRDGSPADDALAVLDTGLTPYWKHKGSKRIEASGAGCPPAGHIDDVIDGFEQTYRALLELRPALVAPHGPLAWFRPLELRCLYRDTARYLELLRDALDNNELRRERLLPGLLADSTDTRLACIIEAELDALLRLDIPRFTALGGATALDLDGTGVANDWFSESGVDRTLRRITAMNSDDLARRSDALRSVYAIASIEACLR